MPAYYPVHLDLTGRPVVVVGGNALAEEKARGLLAVAARVTVIAQAVEAGVAALAAAGEVTLLARRYRAGDLAGAALVLVTAGDGALRDAVFAEAAERRLLINTVDDLPRCNWIAASVLRRGDLTITVSTAGKAPALAVRLRQRLEREIGAEHGRFLALAGTVRAPLAARHPEFAVRKELWYRLVDSDVLDRLRRGDEAGARARFHEILGVAPGELE